MQYLALVPNKKNQGKKNKFISKTAAIKQTT